ncbi:hypothetical protein [Myroides injenensis]|uniref:hypothetical protein n=1 Tax=Myroides injenensis TaxID=1183151 RepID=UPI0002893DB5|nr:hypothetical protein [Myroides injenensis]
MNKIIALIGTFLIVFSIKAQEINTFGGKVGKLMELVTENTIDTLAVKNLLQTMTPSNVALEEGDMDYSIYERFEGDKLYFTKYKSATDDRLSVERLSLNNKPYYSIRFLVNSQYTLDKTGKTIYKDKDYVYNTNYEELSKYCTRPMSYKNGKGNEDDSPLLSCIYTNPNSKRSLMYWVVFEDAVGNKKGNTVKEIKIQDVELWRQ